MIHARFPKYSAIRSRYTSKQLYVSSPLQRLCFNPVDDHCEKKNNSSKPPGRSTQAEAMATRITYRMTAVLGQGAPKYHTKNTKFSKTNLTHIMLSILMSLYFIFFSNFINVFMKVPTRLYARPNRQIHPTPSFHHLWINWPSENLRWDVCHLNPNSIRSQKIKSNVSALAKGGMHNAFENRMY